MLFVEQTLFNEYGLTEHMAQSAALQIGFQRKLNQEPIKTGYIAKIKKLTISQLPAIAKTIETEVLITYQSGELTQVSIKSFQNGILLAEAEMTTILSSDGN